MDVDSSEAKATKSSSSASTESAPSGDGSTSGANRRQSPPMCASSSENPSPANSQNNTSTILSQSKLPEHSQNNASATQSRPEPFYHNAGVILGQSNRGTSTDALAAKASTPSTMGAAPPTTTTTPTETSDDSKKSAQSGDASLDVTIPSTTASAQVEVKQELNCSPSPPLPPHAVSKQPVSSPHKKNYLCDQSADTCFSFNSCMCIVHGRLHRSRVKLNRANAFPKYCNPIPFHCCNYSFC